MCQGYMRAAPSSPWARSLTATRLRLLASTVPPAQLSQILVFTQQMTNQEHCSWSPWRSKSLLTPVQTSHPYDQSINVTQQQDRVNICFFLTVTNRGHVIEPNKVLKMIKAKCLQLIFFESSGKHLSQAPLKPGRNICLVRQHPPSMETGNRISKAVSANGSF